MTYTEFIKGIENNIAKANCNKLNIGEYEEKQKQIYKQIRADAIDEFVKAIEKHQTRQDSYLDPPYVEMGLDMADVLEVAEKLKAG